MTNQEFLFHKNAIQRFISSYYYFCVVIVKSELSCHCRSDFYYLLLAVDFCYTIIYKFPTSLYIPSKDSDSYSSVCLCRVGSDLLFTFFILDKLLG